MTKKHLMASSKILNLLASASLVGTLLAASLTSPASAQAPDPTTTGSPAASSTAAPPTGLGPIPLLAFYYIWFDTTSWDRAKTDLPLLGKYSSDDASVMRQHVTWAKQAGLKGFIVSWKSTDTLNRRLKQLIQIADEQDFKLAIIYQGLDFSRKPLPADRIAADLDYFMANFAQDKAFDLFPKPLVIWSGTWEFSVPDVEKVTQGRRDRLMILASEKNLDGYLRLQDYVDGDAYYWSSVNPDTMKNYQDKLEGMSKAIHANQGLWIAPAASGFDARTIGGTSVVERKNGDTLQTEIQVALASSPDIIGLISWNEFSENSHIEPSQNYGMRYLEVLAEINNQPPPPVAEFDSSEPVQVANPQVAGNKMLAIGGFAFVILGSLGLMALRQMKRPPDDLP